VLDQKLIRENPTSVEENLSLRGKVYKISHIHELTVKKKEIDIEIAGKSDYIDFTINDNGTGVSEKDLKHILKPYYTTKSKGSGLGLSIVNKIIYDHNGKINFEKQQSGAKINIKFQKNGN